MAAEFSATKFGSAKLCRHLLPLFVVEIVGQFSHRNPLEAMAHIF